MRLIQLTVVLLASLSLWSCSPTELSGGETSNMASNIVTVYRPDGVTVASGATIKLFTPGDTSRTPLDQRELDAKGQYDPSELILDTKSPYHNVVIEYDSSEAIFLDSVFLAKDNLSYLKDDTLAPVGAITGTVAIQPNHTPIAVLVHALGTDIYAKIDGETGEFIIGGLGEGEYNLMFTCSYDEYDVELFDTLALSADTTVIVDTIKIPFLGIPVVKGLTSSYDTLQATATISWEKADYSQFASYEVYRTTDLTQWPTVPVAVVTDTSYEDVHTLFGVDSVYYRVGIRNQSGETGLQFGKTAILPISSVEAQTVFTSSLFHIKKQKVVTACSINDSMKVSFGFSNPSRTFTSLTVSEWDEAQSFSELTSTYSDSLSLFVTEDTTIVITTTDDRGDIWSDTITIDVVEDAPVVISVDSTVSLNVLDTIHAVVSDEYGEIVKYEWDLDGDGVFEIETTVPFCEITIAINTFTTEIQIALEVKDDDGNSFSSEKQKVFLL